MRRNAIKLYGSVCTELTLRNKKQKLSLSILSTCETNRSMEISVSAIYIE